MEDDGDGGEEQDGGCPESIEAGDVTEGSEECRAGRDEEHDSDESGKWKGLRGFRSSLPESSENPGF